MVNMYHDISILCFVDFMFYKLVNEIGYGRIDMIHPRAYNALKIGEL